VPLALERAVTRALARSPADRFATAAEFAAALQADRWEEGTGGADTLAGARPRRPMARPVALGLTLLLVALGGYAALRWARPGGVAPLASAAVLPFVDLSPQKDQEYFSDGLTEELITTLSEVPGLRVAARTSSFQFKGQSPDVHEVGRRLDVGAVLEGSVRKSGNRLRVSTQLINVKDGYQLWSESYDRDLTDIFAVQEDVARSIVAALRLRLAPARDSALASRPTRDLAAYDLYLKGLFAWNQRTGPALQEAVRYLEQAVARDSTFARAWAALADAYILWYGDFLAGHGRLTEALAQMRQAHQLDPLSRQIAVELGWTYYVMHQNDSAEVHIRQALELDPNYAQAYYRLGLVRIQQRRYPEAITLIKHALDLGVFYPYGAGGLAFAYGASGDRRAALRLVDDLKRRSARGELVPQFSIAAAYAGLGDRTQGIAWLNRGVDQHDVYLPENFFDPLLDPLRADPSFRLVAARMAR
jgi:TolB-like protein